MLLFMLKKVFLVLALAIIPLTASAYPSEYMNGDHNFRLVGNVEKTAHFLYLDTTSVTVKRNDAGTLLAAGNFFYWDDITDKEYYGPVTFWFYYTTNPLEVGYRTIKFGDRKVALPEYQGEKTAYTSTDDGFTWHKIDLNYEYLDSQAFRRIREYV